MMVNILNDDITLYDKIPFFNGIMGYLIMMAVLQDFQVLPNPDNPEFLRYVASILLVLMIFSNKWLKRLHFT
jgi:hypothetical protein